jgi:enamine deaminase RidA (YjgF/YER057c/UK114 family)
MQTRPINPPNLCKPVGFAHGTLVETRELATLYLGGQCAYDRSGLMLAEGDLVGQLRHALENVGEVLKACGMRYQHLVQLNLYLLSRDDYAAARKEFGLVWRELCGTHYPAMAMFMVAGLYDPKALIEVQGIAVAARGTQGD